MQCIVVRAPSTTWQRIWSPELGYAGLINFFLEWFRIPYLFLVIIVTIVIFWSFASNHRPCDHYPRWPGDAPCLCHQVSKVLRWCTWFSASSSHWLLSSCSGVRRGRRAALRFAFPHCSIARVMAVANINAALLSFLVKAYDQTMAMLSFYREGLLETSALSSAAPAVRISNNTRRSDLEPAHCHPFRLHIFTTSNYMGS